MARYVRLEVDSEGNLNQSGHIVPSNGELPRTQNTYPTINSATAYVGGFAFSTTVVACLCPETEEHEGKQRIEAIYLPEAGKATWKYLMPVSVFLIALYALIYLYTRNDGLPGHQESIMLTLVGLFLVFFAWVPAYRWFKHIYFGAGPDRSARKKMQLKYGNSVRIHTTRKGFDLDASATS